tara:strand:- start:245 stop:631 length:387 start_codon:yes stop_codon:yes gene_type:complete
MPGQIDKLLKAATKQALAELGTALNSTITFTKKTSGIYNTSTGAYSTTDTSFANLKVPVEFIRSEEDEGKEMRQVKVFITPDLINNNQIDLDDEITLTYAGSTVVAKIYNVKTEQGESVYLYTVLARF